MNTSLDDSSLSLLGEFSLLPSKGFLVDEETYKKTVLSYLVKDRFSFVKELALILDTNTLSTFLYVFAGQTIKVPEYSKVYDSFRDIFIYHSLELNNTKEEIELLSKKFNLTKQSIKIIYDKVKTSLSS